jgi:hypothetical protein
MTLITVEGSAIGQRSEAWRLRRVHGGTPVGSGCL